MEVPSDLSGHGVGVAHKAKAILHQPKKTKEGEAEGQVPHDKGKDSWLIIPKSDYIDALAADAASGGNRAMDNNFRLGPIRSTRSRRTISRSVSMTCPLG